MKIQQNDPALNWSDFKRRFEKFVKLLGIGEIRIENKNGDWLIGGRTFLWIGTPQVCHFSHESPICKLQDHNTSHPNLVIRTILGEGDGREKMTGRPAIASLELSMAQQKEGEELDKFPVFRKIQSLLLITYAFKPIQTGLEIYRLIEVNETKMEDDSLILPSELAGTFACKLAKKFQDSVVKEEVPFRCKGQQ